MKLKNSQEKKIRNYDSKIEELKLRYETEMDQSKLLASKIKDMDVDASKMRMRLSNVERDHKINLNNLKLVQEDRDAVLKK